MDRSPSTPPQQRPPSPSREAVSHQPRGRSWQESQGGETLILNLGGTSQMSPLDGVQAPLERLLEAGPSSLTVDVSGVEVTSTTIATLLWVRRRCGARGVEVTVRGPSPRTVNVLRRAGFVDVGRKPILFLGRSDHGDPSIRPGQP